MIDSVENSPDGTEETKNGSPSLNKETSVRNSTNSSAVSCTLKKSSSESCLGPVTNKNSKTKNEQIKTDSMSPVMRSWAKLKSRGRTERAPPIGFLIVSLLMRAFCGTALIVMQLLTFFVVCVESLLWALGKKKSTNSRLVTGTFLTF